MATLLIRARQGYHFLLPFSDAVDAKAVDSTCFRSGRRFCGVYSPTVYSFNDHDHRGMILGALDNVTDRVEPHRTTLLAVQRKGLSVAVVTTAAHTGVLHKVRRQRLYLIRLHSSRE